ncbi:hypothetical protein B2J93_7084 [Marssonina coronariae]|uniref:Uncharacterized protein n=1 Tax=Diplocarpon coronariae TaxID=2795749 RepID=A0A218Z7J4_9HELO|nr:hypothetical protein B2J93_7084 [Marssonina coronariae]
MDRKNRKDRMGSMDRKQGKARPEARTAFQPHPLHQTSTHMLRGERSALASQLGSRGMKCPRRLLKVWLELGEWDMAEMGSVGSGGAGTWFVGGSSWGMRRVHARWSPGESMGGLEGRDDGFLWADDSKFGLLCPA